MNSKDKKSNSLEISLGIKRKLEELLEAKPLNIKEKL